MNSSSWLYLYQSKSREAGRALAQIDIELLESMPTPVVREPECRLISRLTPVARVLHEGSRNGPREPEATNLLSLVERSVDRLVYDLYDLSEAQVSRLEALLWPRLPFPANLPGRKAISSLLDCLEASVKSPD